MKRKNRKIESVGFDASKDRGGHVRVHRTHAQILAEVREMEPYIVERDPKNPELMHARWPLATVTPISEVR